MKINSFACFIVAVALFFSFKNYNRRISNGPGLGNNNYTASELFKPIGKLDATNGAPLGHSNAMMYKGYLAMILGNDSGEKGGGFGFYDISDPRNPVSVFTKVDAATEKIREGHGFGFFNINNRDYVALQTIEGIQIWDWTEINNPFMTANLVLPGVKESDYALGAWWIAVQAQYLYVGASGNGIFIVDVSNPNNPINVKRLPTSQTGGFRVGPIFALGNVLAIGSTDAVGMSVLDISNPTSPSLINYQNSIATLNYSNMINGNYIIGTGIDTRIHLWDFSNPADVKYIGRSSTTVGGGGYVNYQDGFVHGGMSNGYIKFDIRNEDSIKIVGSGVSDIFDYDHDFASVLGNLVLVGNDHGTGSSLIVHDTLADNTAPQVTRVIPAPDAVNQALTSRIGITMSDGIEYASINNETFIVRPIGGQPLEGTYSYQLGILNFTPKKPLDPNKVYEVVVPANGLEDYAGNKTDTQFVSKFSTGSTFNLIGCSLKELPFVELGLNSYFEAEAFNNNNANTTYTWNFGDGTTFGPSSQPFANHVYDSTGRYTVIVKINDGNSQSTCTIQHTVYEKPGGNGPAAASPIITDASGRYVWNINPDNHTLTKTNVQTFVVEKIVETDKNPVSVAQDILGNIWVANKESASIQIFNQQAELIKTIPLQKGTMPAALVISPNRQSAYVSLHANETVIKINTSNYAIEKTQKVGLFPKGLAVSRDNETIYVTQFITQGDTGKVWVLNTADLSVVKTISLQADLTIDSEFGGRGVPNYLNSITISPDSRSAIIPSKKDNIFRGMKRDGNLLNFENTVRSMSSFINLGSRQEEISQRIDINNGDIPTAAIYSAYGNLIFISLQGNNRIDVYDAYRNFLVTSIEDVGDAPQGMSLSSTGDTLFVYSSLSRSVKAFYIKNVVNQINGDIPLLANVKTISFENMDATILKGKKIFYNAKDRRMSQDSYMSCATCHLDGDGDGRTWDLSQFGEGFRNTIPLVGRAGSSKGNVHWSGNFNEIQDFEKQIRELAGGRGFMHDNDFSLGTRNTSMGDDKQGFSEDLDALAAYVASLDKYGSSPYKNIDGTLTSNAMRGQEVFKDAACNTCHSGNEFSDSHKGLFHDIGTQTANSGSRLGKPLLGFDCPTLKGLWMTPPYLHDGSAATLYDALSKENNGMMHGNFNALSETDKQDLIAYLLQLDDDEADNTNPIVLEIKEPEHLHLAAINDVTNIVVSTNLKEVTKIEYYLNGNLLGAKNNVNETLSYQFNNTGTHLFQVKVYHANGKYATASKETKVMVSGNKCDLGVAILPNPVQDKLRIDTKDINNATLKIYDYSGKKVLDTVMKNTSEQFDFSAMPKGVYILSIEKDGCKSVKKFLK